MGGVGRAVATGAADRVRPQPGGIVPTLEKWGFGAFSGVFASPAEEFVLARFIVTRVTPATASRPTLVEALEKRAYLSVSLSAPKVFQVEANSTGNLQAPIIADFNKDGKADLLVVDATSDQNTAGRLAFAAGDGAGNFTLSPSFSGGVFTGQAVAADFNGDGNLDIVDSNSFGNNINVLLGNGNGTFAAPVSVTVGQEPLSLAVADFNGDGRPDVAVGNRTDNTVTVLFGTVAGSGLGSPVTLSGFNDPASVTAGDFNNDLKPDLIVGNAGGTTGLLSFFAGNGAGGFGTAVTTAGPRARTGVGDFNGDGKLDLAVSIADAGTPTVVLGNGDGTFNVGAVPEGGFIALVADIDGDGKADLASGGASDNKVRVLTGTGAGTFNQFVGFTADSPGAGSVGNVNGDGKPDLVFTGLSANGRVIDTLINNSTPGNNGGGGGPTDLTGVVTGRIPVSVVGGAKGKVSVKVINNGPGLLKGPVSVSLYASSDSTLNTGTDTPIKTITKKLKLKAHKGKTLKFSFNYPSNLPDGSYRLLAQVDSGNAVAESDETNNVAVSATPVTIAAPFIDLSGSFASAIPAAAAQGAKESVTVLVQNTGNVVAAGPLTISLTASADNVADAGDTAITSFTKKVKLKPGAKAAIKFKYLLPAGLTGSQFLIAGADTGGTFAESNEGNNTIVSAAPISIT